MTDESLDLGLGAGLPTDRLADLQLVSAGGQGLLYRARDQVLDRYVAVKLLTGASADGSLPRCVSAQARLSWHPHVMSVYDAGTTSTGHPYLVMEYLDGGTAEQLRRRGPVPVQQALRLALQVADALHASHRQGLVHCDVKPSNILLDKDGNARLGDFGLARDVDRTGATLDAIQGSLMYVAPETLEGERPGPASDVYALGLTIHTLLSGEPPFGVARSIGEAIAARLHADRLSFDQLPPRTRLRTLLEGATDPDPEQRPALAELVRELRVANDLEAPAPVVVRPERSRRGWLIAAVALVAGAAVTWAARPADSAATMEFCGLYSSARRDHLLAINTTAQLIGGRALGRSDMQQLFQVYPHDFAAAYTTLLSAAAAKGDIARGLDLVRMRDLEDLSLADAAYRLQHDNGDGIIDVRTLEVRAEGVPAEVVQTARRYTAVVKAGRERCEAGTVRDQDTALRQQLERTVRTVRNGLENRGVDVLGDPTSGSLLDARRMDLLLTMAPRIWNTLRNDPEWLLARLDDPANRRLLFAHHFDRVLEVLSMLPIDGQAELATVPWQQDAAAAWAQLDADDRTNLWSWFPAAARLHLSEPG